MDRPKVASPIIVTNKHRIVYEPENICTPNPRQVNWEAKMLNSPPTSVVTEIVDDFICCLEAAAVVDCDIHTFVSELYIQTLLPMRSAKNLGFLSTRHPPEP